MPVAFMRQDLQYLVISKRLLVASFCPAGIVDIDNITDLGKSFLPFLGKIGKIGCMMVADYPQDIIIINTYTL